MEQGLGAFCRQKKRLLTALALLLLALMPLLYRYQAREEARYLEEDGSLRAIVPGEESVELIVRGSRGQTAVIRTVYLTASEEEAPRRREDPAYDPDETAIVNALIHTVNELKEESRPGEALTLPAAAMDDVALDWERPARGRVYLLPPLAFPVAVLYLYRGEKDRERKKRQREQEEIRTAIPAFNDRLLLLLGSGLIYEDAFLRIAEGYRDYPGDNAFGALLIRVCDRAARLRTDSVLVFEQEAARSDVRALARMTALIRENQYRGADLSEKLASESAMLWDDRRKYAEEQGRLAETRLAAPMGLMLLVLVTIAAAPALMQM